MTPVKWIVLIALATLVAAPTAKSQDTPAPAKFKSVDVEEFDKLSKEEGVVILDVRTPREFEAGHLKGVTLMNYNDKDFVEKIKALDKTKTYLVYCASGVRSERACRKLSQLEFPNLVNLTGGYQAWTKAGKPTEK